MYCSMSSHDEQLKFSLTGQLEDAIGCASELPRLKDGKVKCPAFNHFSGRVNPGDIYLPLLGYVLVSPLVVRPGYFYSHHLGMC